MTHDTPESYPPDVPPDPPVLPVRWQMGCVTLGVPGILGGFALVSSRIGNTTDAGVLASIAALMATVVGTTTVIRWRRQRRAHARTEGPAHGNHDIGAR